MKKVLLSVVTALAVTAAMPAFAADMAVKAKKVVVATPSPWDIAFGTALTSDYVLRGISQSNRKPAVQGYFELRYNINDMVQLYAGVWGSSLYAGFADAEFDLSGGARFTFGNFGLDVGYVNYQYPDGLVNGNGSFGEVYAKGTYKFNDWLSVGATVDGGNNFNNGVGIPTGSKRAYYYSGNATLTLPAFLPWGITSSLNGEIGRQVFDSNIGTFLLANTSYTYWDVGLAFVYKAATLDLRYWDTDAHGRFVSGAAFGSRNLSSSTFVATLKFDTTFSALK